MANAALRRMMTGKSGFHFGFFSAMVVIASFIASKGRNTRDRRTG
jgi:hypothetical protein